MHPIAFSFVKVNLSIFNNTLTVYPNKTGDFRYEMNPWGDEIKPCFYSEIDRLIDLKKIKGIMCFVEWMDKDHDKYHQDTFDLEVPHYHIQFSYTITSDKLKDISEVFLENKVLDRHESDELIKGFQQMYLWEKKITAVNSQIKSLSFFAIKSNDVPTQVIEPMRTQYNS